MADILYDAAVKYGKLLDKGYDIVLGRKKNIYKIRLRFSKDSFFHLSGLQHLTDITYSSTNKERIYKDIIEKKLTNDTIEKSVFYNKFFLKERLTYMGCLEEMFDSCRILFLINHNEYMKYTTIHADHLYQYELPESPESYLYFFSVKESSTKTGNIYKGCSFFKRHEIDYTRGTSEAKLLLNKKIYNIGTNNIQEAELFRHKNYTEGL